MSSVNHLRKNQIKINGLNINYKIFGNGSILIVILHGWGIDSDKYQETAEQLQLQATSYKLQVKIIIPDLPGFGKSEEPREDCGLDDYVEFVDKFIEKANRKSGFELVKNIIKNFNLEKQKGSTGLSPQWSQQNKKIILIGHSFGGRIAIKYAVKYPGKIEKLVLTGSAGIKHHLSIKRKIVFILAKTGKKVFSILKEVRLPIGSRTSFLPKSLASFSRKILYKIACEKDYHQANPRMKEIMKNVLAEDLTPILEQIKIPTLLVWGADDKTTPLADGKIMKEKIKNSELVIIENANHSLPYQKPEEFAKIMTDFIQKNR